METESLRGEYVYLEPSPGPDWTVAGDGGTGEFC